MAIKFTVIENDTKSFQAAMEQEMAKAIKHFEGELIKIRTGRAQPSLVEDLPVSCYGQPAMSLKSLAVIAAPDVRMITIQPWDTSVIGDIQKAIANSDLGLTPTNDGSLIRLQLPEMSSARRDELVKLLHKKLNLAKEAIKSARKDFHNIIRDAKKDKIISEDFFSRLGDILDSVTERMSKQADTLSLKKEKEVTTV